MYRNVSSVAFALWGKCFGSWIWLLLEGGVLKRSIGKCRASERLWWLLANRAPLPPTRLHPPASTQVVTWKCTVKTITNMRFWESIIENGWFRGWPRRTRGISDARSRWQNSSFCKRRQPHKQLRWEPTIKCRLSCHLVWTWQRMLSQIGNQRGPAFSTHARNWLFNSRFLKVWSLGSLGSIQEQNFVF